MKLSECIERLVAKHGGVRALARSAGIDPGYVSRLQWGEKDQPSDVLLAALGIERVVSYRLSKKPPQPFERLSDANAAAYHGIDND